MSDRPDPRGTGPASVLIVDDHVVLAQSLSLALSTRPNLDVEVAAELTPPAVLREVATRRPDLVLLDLDLGEHGDATPLLTQLARRGDRVLMLTASTDPLRHATSLEAGAVGVLVKSVGLVELSDQVEWVARGGEPRGSDHAALLSRLASHRAARNGRLAPFEGLTRREQHVLRELMAGKRVAEIAADAVLSVATIRSQVRGILEKLDVQSQAAAIERARDAEWGPTG